MSLYRFVLGKVAGFMAILLKTVPDDNVAWMSVEVLAELKGRLREGESAVRAWISAW
jgi:hypothetical protein